MGRVIRVIYSNGSFDYVKRGPVLLFLINSRKIVGIPAEPLPREMAKWLRLRYKLIYDPERNMIRFKLK